MAKVLVVDDSLSVRKVVEKTLEAKSIQVLAAASGNEAIERIERDQPDVIICDVILPDRDGYEICEFVRKHPRLAKVPVLLISGVVNSTVLGRAAEVQSNDVMFKPFAADELARKVDELLSLRVPVLNGAPRGADIPARAVAVSPLAVTASIERPSTTGPSDLKTRLVSFVDIPEVSFAAIVDHEGFLVEAAGGMGLESEVAGALTSCLAEASEGIGRDLGQGALRGMILEYEDGILLVHNVATSALLVVFLRDSSALGKVRYYVKKALPDLARLL